MYHSQQDVPSTLCYHRTRCLVTWSEKKVNSPSSKDIEVSSTN